MIINALKLKYEADMKAAAANIEVYRKNPSGIGEHPDMVLLLIQNSLNLHMLKIN